jgi:hypothetical protein
VELPIVVRTRTGSRRVRTCEEAIRLIDQEVPHELRRLPRWTFARKLFEVAVHSKRKKDVTAAVRQLMQAVTNEGW